MLLQLCEIREGLVAYLCPATLSAYGARCPFPQTDRVEGVHPFVCIWTDGESSVWVPLSSRANHRRMMRVAASMKLGHPSWTGRDSYVYGYHHVWCGPNHAFQEASEPELSPVGRRNSVDPSTVVMIRAAVAPVWPTNGRAA